MRQKIKFSKACISTALIMGVVISSIGGRGFAKADDSVSPSPSPTLEASIEPSASAQPTATATATVQPSASATVQPTASTTPVPTATVQPSPSVQPIGNLIAPDVIRVAMSGNQLAAEFTYVNNCSGYEVEVCKKSNDQVVKSGEASSTIVMVNNLPRNAVYYVHARSYALTSTGVVFSDWGSKGYAVAQPEFNKGGSKLNKNSIKLKWGKVAGASQYIIDMRKRGTNKWYRVKTVKGKKNSCKITKLRGKRFNSHKTNFELRIRATAKIGGKKYTSSGANTIYTYTYYRYR